MKNFSFWVATMDEELQEAAAPRWKRAGPNGEIQATIGGKKYQIEKALDHNERHKGEWKVMVWDKRRRDWEWETTEYSKANAKAWIMDRLKEETIDEDSPCWDGYKQVGTKKKGKRTVPNCVPEDAPVNAVGTDGGVDLNPTGRPVKMDRRSRWDVSKLFRRANGPKKKQDK